MIYPLLIVVFILLGQSFLNVFVWLFHAESSVFLLAPIVLVFCVFYFRTLEALWILLLSGFLIDYLTGSFYGLNMFSLVFLGFLGIIISSWLGKPHGPMVIVFLLITSCVYRLILIQTGNWEIGNFLLGPWVDAGVGFLIFYSLPRQVTKMD